jgi:hypothetical protein
VTDVLSDRFIASDIEEASAFYRNGASDGIFRVDCDDLSIGENEIRGLRSGLYARVPGNNGGEGESGYFEKFSSVTFHVGHSVPPSSVSRQCSR